MRDKVRKHFYFSGDVQMVGFRYQAKYAADDLGLTGWVRQCRSGSSICVGICI